MQNTAIAYLCRRALLPASSIHNQVDNITWRNSSWAEVKKKKKPKYTRIEALLSGGKKKKWLDCYLFELPHAAVTAFLHVQLLLDRWAGICKCCIRTQIYRCRHEAVGGFVSTLTTNRQIICFYLIQCIWNDGFDIKL